FVDSISDAVGVEHGRGCLVTGTFSRTVGDIVELRFSGEVEPIGTTASHPFWSLDRNGWAPAGELQMGERVKTVPGEETGAVSVVGSEHRSSMARVYNIEVERAHTYAVSAARILVHNSCRIGVYQLGENGQATIGAANREDIPSHIQLRTAMKNLGV